MLVASGTLITPGSEPESPPSPVAWLQSRLRAGGHISLRWHLLPVVSINYSPVTVPVTSFQTSIQERREGTQRWAARVSPARLGQPCCLCRQSRSEEGVPEGHWQGARGQVMMRMVNSIGARSLSPPSCK